MEVTVIHFDEIESTNAYLKENYNDLPSFTYAQADYQTGGKGRNDRKWESNNKENLLFSLLIKEESIMNDFHLLSMGTAYVIARHLEAHGVSGVLVKWPNDVYVNGKKICGILLEGSLPNYLVIGVGLNVNQKEFPDDLRTPATSLANELGYILNIQSVFSSVLNELTTFITSLKENMNRCEQFIASHNYLAGKRIKIGDIEGRVAGFDKDFALLVDTQREIKTISSGEIDFIFTK